MKIFIIKRIIIAVSINLFYSIILSLTCAGVLLAEESKGQYKSIKEVFITVDLSEVPIKKVFDAIEKQTDFKFTYKKELLTQAATSKLTVKSGRKSVACVLKKIANETGFSLKQHNNIIGVTSCQRNLLMGNLRKYYLTGSCIPQWDTLVIFLDNLV